MIDPHPNMTGSVIAGLAWLYLLLFAMNALWTYYSLKRGDHRVVWIPIFGRQDIPVASLWGLYATFVLLLSMAHFAYSGDPAAFLIRMPDWFKSIVDSFAQPTWFFGLAVAGFTAMVMLREWWVKPTVAWVLLNASLLFLALSLTDYDFRQIVGKPDNVPIVSMLFILGFFTWLFFKQAVENDRRREEGRPLIEEENSEKILVWPDLVYSEMLCMILLTVVLVLWGVALQAPLEEPASSVKTPNPSKAPWYFLGLQEMLVYYDPWLAGVVFPTMILVGLMAIPYIDFNKLGNGYYTFNERKFAIVTFMFGFLPMWVAMIILGTFLRGPNWNFFGIYEYWDVHKLEALNNVNLSELIWIDLLGAGMPSVTLAGVFPAFLPELLVDSLLILIRESPGFIVVGIYLGVGPFFLVMVPYFRKFFDRMGFIRFMVFAQLLLFMAALPLKMVLRWGFNLKYIIAIPEWFFNV